MHARQHHPLGSAPFPFPFPVPRISAYEWTTPSVCEVTFWKKDRVDIKKRSSKLYSALCSFRKQEAAMYNVDVGCHVIPSRIQ